MKIADALSLGGIVPSAFPFGGELVCYFRFGGLLFLLAVLPVIMACAKPGQQAKTKTAVIPLKKVIPGKIVYLKETSNWEIPFKDEGQQSCESVKKLLVRQFCRQAFLLAAREEMGLTTRDEAIGDFFPAEKVDELLFMEAESEDSPGIYVRRLADGVQLVEQFSFDGDYLNAAIDAERMSRECYVGVLKKLGFSGEANKINTDAKVPPQVEPLLAEMTFTSQFHAVRLLHEAIRHNGESGELLGALVRGYANLGWLTEHHWLAGPDVFKARAILYAQRMVARGDHPAWAKRHRAYALAALGLHSKAIDELNSTGVPTNDNSGANLDNRQPAWVNLIEAHCLFKLDDLKSTKTDKTQSQLAELLRVINLDISNGKDNRVYHANALMDAVKTMPECYRAVDSLCSRSGVGLGQMSTLLGLHTLGQKLYLRLAAIPDLPAGSKKIIARQVSASSALGRLFGSKQLSLEKELVVRGQLIDALMGFSDSDTEDSGNKSTESGKKTESTSEADHGEPSWATLGYLIREVSFLQVWQRIHFERFMLSVQTDEFLKMVAPLIAHHPCRACIEIYTTNPAKKQEVLQQTDTLPLWNMDATAFDALRIVNMKSPEEFNIQTNKFLQNSDFLATDLSSMMHSINEPAGKVRFARELLKVSSNCPNAKGFLIQYDWDTVAQFADRWEKESSGSNAYVLGCLASKYSKLKRYDDAERCYKAAIEVSPDNDLYQSLAAIYKHQGKTDKWLEALEEFLNQPNYGLEHAWVRVQIADFYRANGDWEKALSYAEEAAKSYSCWSLRSAGECHERLAHWDEAERYFQAIARRYEDSCMVWYFFCRRTGHGNLKAANELAKTHADEAEKFDMSSRFNENGVYYLLINDHKKALDSFYGYFKKEDALYEGLLAALTADELGDNNMRDLILKDIEERAKWLIENNKPCYYEMRQLARLMSEDIAQGGKAEFYSGDYDKIIENSNEQTRMISHYFLGKYLQLHGQQDRAIHYWKLCLASDYIFGWNRTLAGAELIKCGYKGDCYKTSIKETKQSKDATDTAPTKEKKAEHK